jgi:hypothetical protein
MLIFGAVDRAIVCDRAERKLSRRWLRHVFDVAHQLQNVSASHFRSP